MEFIVRGKSVRNFTMKRQFGKEKKGAADQKSIRGVAKKNPGESPRGGGELFFSDESSETPGLIEGGGKTHDGGITREQSSHKRKGIKVYQKGGYSRAREKKKVQGKSLGLDLKNRTPRG